jgi:GTPase SAR1 family protein
MYPRWNAIVTDIEVCHRRHALAAEPPCLLLVGPTGAGKTTLTESYAARFPVIVTDTGVQRRVRHATIPSPATIKNLSMELLYTLGDPRYDTGTIGSMTKRVVNFLRDGQVELLILDELQHFVDLDNQTVLQNASNWLKTLIKDRELKIACVVVGLEYEAAQVVDVTPQLARLFGDPFVLTPFTWEEQTPTTVWEFRTLLHALEARLPLNAPAHLTHRERAWRCFVASEGVISYLMALLRQATTLALMRGQECLDDMLLAEAFDQRLAGQRRGIPNPFLGDIPARPGAAMARPGAETHHRKRSHKR